MFTIVLLIIVGIIIGAITFFLIRSVIGPKRILTLANYVKQKKNNQAARLAKQIINRDPRNADAHYLLGLAYLGDGKNELALMEFQTVNLIGNFGGICKEAPFRRKTAELYQSFEQHDEALKEYLMLVKLEPSDPEHYYNAGLLFEERNKTDTAVNYFRKTVELNPRHSNGHFALGRILYRDKRPIEAKLELDQALKYQPENYQAHFYLGRLLKENHDYVGALISFEKAQKDPEIKLKALVERGACYMSMNNFERALPELERVVKLTENDSDPEVLYGRYFLAMCYEKMHDIDKAIDQWEKIYSKKPAFRDVAEKLGQYQDLRTDDRMKDFLTAPKELYIEICKALVKTMSLSIQDMTEVPNGCEILAVEAESKWRNTRKMPVLIRFVRVGEIIDESTVRVFNEKAKKLNVNRGILVSSSNFSLVAMDFAETRPLDLIGKDRLQELLKNTQIPTVPTKTK